MVFLPSWSSCFLIEAAVAAVLAVSSPQPASVAAMAMTRSVFMMNTIGGNGRHARQQSPLLPCGRTEKVKAAALDASSVEPLDVAVIPPGHTLEEVVDP